MQERVYKIANRMCSITIERAIKAIKRDLMMRVCIEICLIKLIWLIEKIYGTRQEIPFSGLNLR